MANIYFCRHQAAGVLHAYPFAAQPTQEQRDALAKLCFQAHGATHPKTKEPYWFNVVEVSVLGSELPNVPERSLSVANAAGVDQFEVSGRGEVRNPKR